MQITDFKKSLNSKSRMNVYVDGELAFPLYTSDICKLNLKISQNLSEEELEKILNGVVRKNALNDALKLIARTDYTKKMIFEKLFLKNYPSKVILYVTDYLLKSGYIDDYEYAKRFIKNAFSNKKKGKEYVSFELTKRGIEKELILSLTEEYFNEERIKEIAENKLKSLLKGNDNPDFKVFLKLKNYLLRQGFSFDEVISETNRLKENYEE